MHNKSGRPASDSLVALSNQLPEACFPPSLLVLADTPAVKVADRGQCYTAEYKTIAATECIVAGLMK